MSEEALRIFKDETRSIEEMLQHTYDLPQSKAGVVDWGGKNKCLGVSLEIVFPERGASTQPMKDLCNTCAVKDPCLEYALTNMEKVGIWGGTSEHERKKIRAARKAVAKSLSESTRIEDI